MENDLGRLIKEREELEDRCTKLIDENKTLTPKIAELEANLRTAQHKIEQQENWLDKYRKRNEQLSEVLLPVLEHKIHFIVDNAVHDQLEDIDITAHGYFDTAVCEVIRDYDFSDVIKEAVSEIDLDSKVAQVINNYDFSEISFISDLVEEAVADIDLDYKVADIINNGEFRFTR
tara:strand:+ start:20 stop:544 length:525 start_codon:yes stop_codon:yes gene_type:complete